MEHAIVALQYVDFCGQELICSASYSPASLSACKSQPTRRRPAPACPMLSRNVAAAYGRPKTRLRTKNAWSDISSRWKIAQKRLRNERGVVPLASQLRSYPEPSDPVMRRALAIVRIKLISLTEPVAWSVSSLGPAPEPPRRNSRRNTQHPRR